MRSSMLVLAAALAVVGCRQNSSRQGDTDPLSVEGPSASKPATLGPIRMELFDAAKDQAPMYVLRGEPKGTDRLVFLHGMCGHALGYAQSFQFSAAKHGTLLAPQGDRRCGNGPWAMWSADLDALDARIVATFRALGEKEPIRDVLIMGYSQGATRAEALARKWPERYTRLISLGAPRATSARGLQHLRGAVMMAGELDRQDQMKTGMRALRAAGVPVTFVEIPGARHGAMGKTPERTMGQALDWLAANAANAAE